MKNLIFILSLLLAACARAQTVTNTNTVTLTWNYPAPAVTNPQDLSFILSTTSDLHLPFTNLANFPSTLFTNAIFGTNMVCRVQLLVAPVAAFWCVQATSSFWGLSTISNIASNPPAPVLFNVGIKSP